MRVHISAATMRCLENTNFKTESRGTVELKVWCKRYYVHIVPVACKILNFYKSKFPCIILPFAVVDYHFYVSFVNREKARHELTGWLDEETKRNLLLFQLTKWIAVLQTYYSDRALFLWDLRSEDVSLQKWTRVFSL